MNTLVARAFAITALFALVAPLAQAQAAFVCDRQKVQQAIAVAKSSPQIEAYAKTPQRKARVPVSAKVNKIFRNLEDATFGRKFLTIEDFPMWPGATIQDNHIQLSSMTVKTLTTNLKNPEVGIAFEIAHEMGHLVQKIAGSPHGFDDVAPGDFTGKTTPEAANKFNTLHAETDCIATEIIYQAGYKLNEDVINTLTQIKQECLNEQTTEFCESADQIRKAAVQAYIMVIAVEAKSFESLAHEPTSGQNRPLQNVITQPKEDRFLPVETRGDF